MPTNETWNSSDPWKEIHKVLSLFIPLSLFLIKFSFFFAESPLMRVPHNCIMISRVLPLVIIFDHSEHITDRVL